MKEFDQIYLPQVKKKVEILFKKLICRIKSTQSPDQNPQKKSFKVETKM